MTTAAVSSTFALLSALPAAGPHPTYRDQLMLFGQFVGVWDLDVMFFDEAGNVVFHGPGEWAFAWVLDGRALQDVLTYADVHDPMANAPGQRRTGTSLRQYHPLQALDVLKQVGLLSPNPAFRVLQQDVDLKQRKRQE
jgi:hypothetical protein